MSKKIKLGIEKIFNIIYPLLKFEWIQHTMRNLGFKLPYYRFAEKLDYRGVVDFVVNNKRLYLQSYNQPIEMFIFWYGIFGEWESTQLKLWSALVKQSDIVLDIGANTGVYSLIATTNSEAKIYAFEPVPDVVKMLEKNIELNQPNNIFLKTQLIGDRIGSETLYIPRSGWVDVASVNKEFANNYRQGNVMTELPCPMTTVDAFLDELNITDDLSVLCKIDVEGAEERVLQGMVNAMRSRRLTFMIEILNKDYFSRLYNMLPQEYEIIAIDEGQKKIYKVQEFANGVTNYLCSKQNLSSADFNL
ncbi:MAG: FkbM family methyltransferase [Candidatus Nomurabacteria bacterium]|nr:FkbM family methyltransferase [Candidatus Nomurabacteria bacterium]USN88129.1 MAG: FkbM family methyltransferase [Candidatus Nomurabacteria bacterium]